MRITVTTYGSVQPHQALGQAGVALQATTHKELESCGFTFGDGSQAFVEKTRAGNWTIKVQQFDAPVPMDLNRVPQD